MAAGPESTRRREWRTTAAPVIFAIGDLLGKACSLPLPGGADYLRGVRAGIEADKDSPPEPFT
jgi:hypothetical protein